MQSALLVDWTGADSDANSPETDVWAEVHLLLLLLAEVRQLLSRSFPIEQLLLLPQPERVDRLQVAEEADAEEVAYLID